MDPLSITSASIALAAAVYKTSVEVKRIVGVMNDATESLSDLSEEVQIVHAALQSVENALNEDNEAIERYKVDEVFAIAVKGCRATLSCIEREFEILFNRQDWKVKFMVLWKEDNMNKLLARLCRKRDSIMLLVQLLSLRSVKEIRTLVAEKKDSLTVAKDDITALVPTYWSCRATILDSLDRATAESIYADMESRDSRISTTEFDFDFEILNTRTYRRALTQPRSKHHREGSLHSRDSIAPSRVIGNLDEDLIDLRSQLDAQSRQSLQRLPNACADLQGLELTTDKLLDRVTDSEGLVHSEKNGSSGSPMDSLQRNSRSSKASSNRGMQQTQKSSPSLLHPLGASSDVSLLNPRYPPKNSSVPLSSYKPRPGGIMERLLEEQRFPEISFSFSEKKRSQETTLSESMRLRWEKRRYPVIQHLIKDAPLPLSSFKPEPEDFAARLVLKFRQRLSSDEKPKPKASLSGGREIAAEVIPKILEPGVLYSC